MLLSDLDEILARGEVEKRDINRQITEVENAKQFMERRFASSVNRFLSDSVITLKQQIKI